MLFINGKIKKTSIIIINSLIFFFGWSIIMLLGADSPPPKNFYLLIILILILDLIQVKYLQYFLPRIRKGEKKFFLKNMLFYSFGGFLLSLLIFFGNSGPTLEVVIPWILIISVVSLIYGIFFWFLNGILIRGKLRFCFK